MWVMFLNRDKKIIISSLSLSSSSFFSFLFFIFFSPLSILFLLFFHLASSSLIHPMILLPSSSNSSLWYRFGNSTFFSNESKIIFWCTFDSEVNHVHSFSLSLSLSFSLSFSWILKLHLLFFRTQVRDREREREKEKEGRRKNWREKRMKNFSPQFFPPVLISSSIEFCSFFLFLSFFFFLLSPYLSSHLSEHEIDWECESIINKSKRVKINFWKNHSLVSLSFSFTFFSLSLSSLLIHFFSLSINQKKTNYYNSFFNWIKYFNFYKFMSLFIIQLII